MLIALAAEGQGFVLGFPGLRSVLAWIGDRSYSIYVFQVWCLSLANIAANNLVGPDSGPGIRLILLILSTAIIAEVAYRWVELPARGE